MERYAKIINEETKEVKVGVGCDDEYYKEIGMTIMDVEQAYTGDWYVKGYAPEKPVPPPPTKEEIKQLREYAYCEDVDPITCHINRLRDEEQTPEIEQEIADLQAERTAKVEEIKERYPYPEQPTKE